MTVPATAMSTFERLIDHAWPAPYQEVFDGWRLRYAGGVTKRANSVWAAAEPDDPMKAIAAAEDFYETRGLPVVFSVSPAASCPPDLDALLAERGYAVADPTLVMTRDLSGAQPSARGVALSDRPSDEWLGRWWSVDGRYPDGLPAAVEILTGVPATYATAGDGDRMGVGRSVRHGDWLGIYCMAVAPEARRQGLATMALEALLDQGRAEGARRAYLCVTDRNIAARALYERAGFDVAGAYHYRILPGDTRAR